MKRWILSRPRCSNCGRFIAKGGFEVPSYSTFPYEGPTINYYCKQHGEERGLAEDLRGPRLEVDS